MERRLVGRVGWLSLAAVLLSCGDDAPAPFAAAAVSDASTASRGRSSPPPAAVDAGVGPSGASDGGPNLLDPDSDPLIGDWELGVGSCTYTYSFHADGTYILTATSGERVLGSYELFPPDTPGGRWQLNDAVTSDNNGVDCEGDEIDETGRSRTAFLEFVDENYVRFYTSETGGSPRFELARVQNQ